MCISMLLSFLGFFLSFSDLENLFNEVKGQACEEQKRDSAYGHFFTQLYSPLLPSCTRSDDMRLKLNHIVHRDTISKGFLLLVRFVVEDRQCELKG